MTDIVILDGARTAIGTFGGSLAANPLLNWAQSRRKRHLNGLVLMAGRSGTLYLVT